MAHRLNVRRAFDGSLSRSLPKGDGLYTQARLGVVLRQQFGLCLGGLRELRLQHLGNPLMVLLPHTAQQRLVGSIPNQGMLKEVGRLGWYPHRRQPVMSRSHRFANVHKGWHSCRAKRGAPTMQRCGSPVENEFEQFLHALPPDWAALMRDLGAFTYAGKIRSPEELLHALFLYGGPDQSLREVAGTLTLHAERITDQAVWKRLHRCAPFLKALLQRMLPLDALPPVPQHLRFLACDGTTVQCPGATSNDYRLHLVINLVTLGLHDVQVTETKTGESLKRYRLQPGDVMVGDQGYCSYTGILEAVDQQHADVLVRWNHQRALYDPHAPDRALDFCTILRPQAPGMLVSFPVVLQYAKTRKTKDQRALQGTLHVYRMQEKEAQAARKKVSRKHQRKQRKLSAKTLFLRQFVCVFTSISPTVLCGETALALYRCRWQIELAIKRMKSLLHSRWREIRN